MVYRTVLSLERNPADADDIAQETLVKAFNALHNFREGTDAKAWLLTILRNTRIDHMRSRKALAATTVSLEQLPFEVGSAKDANEEIPWEHPEEILQQFSDRQIVQALRHLPEDIRWTLLLVDIEGMEHADAAMILDIPVGTVKSRAFRGRSMLREALYPLAKELRLIRE